MASVWVRCSNLRGPGELGRSPSSRSCLIDRATRTTAPDQVNFWVVIFDSRGIAPLGLNRRYSHRLTYTRPTSTGTSISGPTTPASV